MMKMIQLREACATCGKKGFFVSKRSYVVPKVSRKPITSVGKLCGGCYRKIKAVISHDVH